MVDACDSKVELVRVEGKEYRSAVLVVDDVTKRRTWCSVVIGMIYLEGNDTEGTYGDCLGIGQHLACAEGERLSLGYILVAIDFNATFCILFGIFSVVALSRGSAIYTLPRCSPF